MEHRLLDLGGCQCFIEGWIDTLSLKEVMCTVLQKPDMLDFALFPNFLLQLPVEILVDDPRGSS